MRQSPLFYDSAMHAVECAISASGRHFKEVAAHLWPAKKPDTAEKAALQREFLNGLKSMEVLAARLERLGGK